MLSTSVNDRSVSTIATAGPFSVKVVLKFNPDAVLLSASKSSTGASLMALMLTVVVAVLLTVPCVSVTVISMVRVVPGLSPSFT